MRRTFQDHIVRREISLDGFWEFVRDEERRGDAETWKKNFPRQPELMAVPSCWDTKSRHFEYNGLGWYRKEFILERSARVLLHFEGVSGKSEIFVDGSRIGRHNGSYTPFSCLTKPMAAGRHELIVKVDNFLYPGRVMPDYADWFLYGGIFRSVSMAPLDSVWIKRLDINYQIKDGLVLPTPRVTMQNIGRKSISDRVRFYLNGLQAASMHLKLAAGEEQIVECSLGELDLPLWSPDAPALHSVRVEYGGDDLCERTGFRKVEMLKDCFVVNGKRMKILGVNRHHEYGDNGFAVPADITLRDFEIIRDMGCNAVRCHYPIDRYAMDICDELGLFFWAEIPFYGRWDRVVGQKRYIALGERCLEDMISNHLNHPSIFTWSVLNECATETEDGVETVQRLTAKARACDSQRPISYATNKVMMDQGCKHLDLLGINAYPGWYDAAKDKPEEWSQIIIALKKKLTQEGLEKLPILVTETGAGAIYGDRTLEHRHWNENRQAQILRKNLTFLLGCDEVAGVFVWQFCDIRTQSQNWNGRPGCFNNKGLLDRFRRPKMAYYEVKEIFQASNLE